MWDGPGAPRGGGHHGGGHHDVVLHLQRTLHEIGDRELTTFLAYGAHLDCLRSVCVISPFIEMAGNSNSNIVSAMVFRT